MTRGNEELVKRIQRSITTGNVVATATLALWSLLPPRLSPPIVPYAVLVVANVVLVVGWNAAVHYVAGPLVARRLLRPVADYLATDRPATEQEIRSLVGLPLKLAMANTGGWVIACALEAALNMGFMYHPADWPVFRFSVAIGLCAYAAGLLGMVLMEREMRPVFARAFHDAQVPVTRSHSVRTRLGFLWGMAGVLPFVAISDAVTGLNAQQMLLMRPGLYQLCGLTALAGALVTRAGAGSIIEPVTELEHAMRRVADGDLEVAVVADRPGELGAVQAGFNRMVAELRTQRALEALFRRHVGTEVATRALEQGLVMTGERREATIVSVRIALAIDLDSPAARIDQLNEVFETVVSIVNDERGWVNKLSERGAMCVFGPLANDDDHATGALRAARRLQDALAGVAAVHASIGAATGWVVAGNVGAFDRHEYTVIGEPANAAARLAELAAAQAERVLATEACVHAAEPIERNTWRPEGAKVLRGWPDPVMVFVPTVRAEVPV
ncbi:MAG: HAMP domain-containing protein [Acidimicrobiales bacterium]|nr:HAMP domain-containing protein [Acidimicrobiales bacterium]